MGLLSWLGLVAELQQEPVALSDLNFNAEVLRSDLPVVVDVWSNGCRPCQVLAPTIMRLAGKYAGRVKVAQLNASEGAQTAKKFDILGTPTVLFFKAGKEVERVVGVRGQLYYEEIIDSDLLGLAPDLAPGLEPEGQCVASEEPQKDQEA